MPRGIVTSKQKEGRREREKRGKGGRRREGRAVSIPRYPQRADASFRGRCRAYAAGLQCLDLYFSGRLPTLPLPPPAATFCVTLLYFQTHYMALLGASHSHASTKAITSHTGCFHSLNYRTPPDLPLRCLADAADSYSTQRGLGLPVRSVDASFLIASPRRCLLRRISRRASSLTLYILHGRRARVLSTGRGRHVGMATHTFYRNKNYHRWRSPFSTAIHWRGS